MIVRGKNLATGQVIEIEIAAEIPVQARLSIEDLCVVYPRRAGTPNSRSTIKRWLAAGLIPHSRIGSQVFVRPDQLPDAVKGVRRQ